MILGGSGGGILGDSGGCFLGGGRGGGELPNGLKLNAVDVLGVIGGVGEELVNIFVFFFVFILLLPFSLLL
jgi:hypothetical protein